jgi:hypothetical protein
VCATLAQCGELFLQLPGVSTTPLLVQALAAEDGSSADLLFDSGKEAEAWKVGGLVVWRGVLWNGGWHAPCFGADAREMVVSSWQACAACSSFILQPAESTLQLWPIASNLAMLFPACLAGACGGC